MPRMSLIAWIYRSWGSGGVVTRVPVVRFWFTTEATFERVSKDKSLSMAAGHSFWLRLLPSPDAGHM